MMFATLVVRTSQAVTNRLLVAVPEAALEGLGAGDQPAEHVVRVVEALEILHRRILHLLLLVYCVIAVNSV